MQIFFKKSFFKQYKKLRKNDRVKVDGTLVVFAKNPQNPVLGNHALTGKLSGKRSISAGFDLRIIFEVEGDYAVAIMIAVGTHNQVY